MYDFINKLQDVMLFNDVIPPHLDITSTKINRFKSQGICKHNCCFYSIFYNQIGAYFGCWRRDIHVKWFAKNFESLTVQEKQNYLHQKEKLRKENEAKKDIAKLRCKTKWDHSIEACESHAYLIKKRIKPIYCRQHGEDLIIPIYDHFGEIQSLQSIHPDGFKLYEEGSSYKGGYLPLGEKINGTLRLCEGYATGCSIYEAIGEPVFVCFTANNLIHIAKWIRKKYPHFPIQICADDDRRTEKKIGKNIGLIAAIHAAKEINATVIYPDFTLIPHSENLTDFNDLFCVSGIEAVENQLLKGVSK